MMEQINIIRSDFYGEWNYTITQEAYQIVHVNFLQTLMWRRVGNGIYRDLEDMVLHWHKQECRWILSHSHTLDNPFIVAEDIIDMNLEIVSFSDLIFEKALRFMKQHRLMSNDAVHLATMKRYGVTNIATNDRDFEQVEWLKVWKPRWMPLHKR